jgi:hypothetical protein
MHMAHRCAVGGLSVAVNNDADWPADGLHAERTLRAPMCGLMQTQLECRACGYRQVRHDRFVCLSLTLPYLPSVCVRCMRAQRKLLV